MLRGCSGFRRRTAYVVPTADLIASDTLGFVNSVFPAANPRADLTSINWALLPFSIRRRNSVAVTFSSNLLLLKKEERCSVPKDSGWGGANRRFGSANPHQPAGIAPSVFQQF